MTERRNQEIHMKDYLQESSRTAPVFTELPINQYSYDTLKNLIDVFLQEGEVLDQVKKHIYYGKPYKSDNVVLGKEDAYVANSKEADLIHGIVGKMTEVVELFEVLKDVLNHNKIDEVNLIEEIGDDNWYTAMLLRTVNSTFEESGRVNINKLFQRFPDKFDADKAIHRNVDTERTILEKDVKTDK